MLENTLVTLDDELVKSMRTCEIVKIHEKEINSVDFSQDGNLIVTSGRDDLLCVYDIDRREIVKKFYNRVFGVENAVFTHSSKAILCSSNKDFRIMYWCLHNNEVLYSFLGHSDLITDITINPINDLFLTTSRDKTSRLWDLSKRQCACIFQDSNFATFDDTGKVVASVSFESDKQANFINLYAVESILKGPFKVFKVDLNFEIKQIRFTDDGTLIVCNTSENTIVICDAYEGNQKHKISGVEINESDNCYKTSISADSKYLSSGTESGNVLIWNILNNKLLCTLECHPQTSMCVKWSPKHALLATACTNLVLWHPNK